MRFLWTFAAALATGAAVVVALLVLLDPYDTGRWTPLRKPGVTMREPRFADVSRGRDPSFDAAIVGNSHVEELEPAALSAASGLHFVSLAVPGSGPREQLAVLDWFVRQRPAPPAALVVGIDDSWCTGDPALSNDRPFPFWLYAQTGSDYLRGLVRLQSLADAFSRLAYLVGLRRRATPDGFLDYEPIYVKGGFAEPARRSARLAQPLDTTVPNPSGRFPAAERLAATLTRLSDPTAVLLLRPPAFVTALPPAGTAAAATDAACRAAFAGVAAQRARTVLVDWRTDRPENRRPENYFEHTHYGRAVARLVESDIVATLGRLRRGDSIAPAPKP